MLGGPSERARSGIDGCLSTLADRLRAITVQVHGEPAGVGSGVLWSRDGLIVTNAHVVRGRVNVKLPGGRVVMARLLARDPEHDLAVLAIDAHGLAAAEIGDSDRLRVGQLVVAVGNPLGLAGAVTAGLIHAIGPRRPAGPSLIQADLRLAPGNSGGPLADARGRVIGINAMIAGGLALAVPTRLVARFLASPRSARVTVP